MAREIKYWRAFNEAMSEEMERDERVCLFGEDAGLSGGAFGISRGLQKKFGNVRVRDTPISEGVIAGCATGAAMTGLRPVAEIMFFNFMTLAMDQLYNHASMLSFMSNGKLKVPLTILTLCGAGRNSGPQHTSSLEAWLGHIPGIKAVAPATPYDAKGLMKAAIRDDNPVVVIGSLNAWNLTGPIPDEDFLVPIGLADIKRAGRDLSLITLGPAVAKTLSVAEELATVGIEAEVVDLRSISPLDTETIMRSVAKTGRAMVIQDSVVPYGFGAEVSAQINQELWGALKAPVVRVGAAFTPTPFSPELSKGHYPQIDAIIDQAKRLVG